MYEVASHLRYVLGAHGSHAIVGEIEFDDIFVARHRHRHGFRAFRTQAVITISTFLAVDLTSMRKKTRMKISTSAHTVFFITLLPEPNCGNRMTNHRKDTDRCTRVHAFIQRSIPNKRGARRDL